MKIKQRSLIRAHFEWKCKHICVLWIACVVILAKITVEGLECYSCDSTENPECATKPGQQISVEECHSDNDECVQVVVSGITRRGCLSRLFPSRYCPEPCERCSKNLCNRDVFPHDRLRCYQCLGADCVNVDYKPQLIMPCPFYHDNDRCFMKVLHINNVHRGCEHSVEDANDCVNTCIKCNRDGCNKEPGTLERNCIECSHTAASPNPECWRGQEFQGKSICVSRPSTHCQNKNLYGEESQCFTYINEQTGVVNRGCSSKKPFYPTGNLTECYGENCNNECLTISCNICSSKDDPNCILGKNLKSAKCSEGTNSCFSCENGKHVRRGCADDEFQKSRQSHEACYFCQDSSSSACNRFPVRTCYSCSSLEEEDCALMTYPDTTNKRNCSSHDDICVSTVASKLKLAYVLRGCASHLEECTKNDPLCVRCNGSLCNDVSIDLSNIDGNYWKSDKHVLAPIDDHFNTQVKGSGYRLYASSLMALLILLVALCYTVY
ncbi:uncharacterized protein LOC142227116 [Haematobia irritans]|uniref:uncharacterized protein LOC142227116 n=1 Tax=Haematobia irritans TaxID=7368 RepID=UPI003F505751